MVKRRGDRERDLEREAERLPDLDLLLPLLLLPLSDPE